MNTLKVDRVNINNLTVIKSLNKKLKKIVEKKLCYHKLYCKKNGTFKLKKEITQEPGWYIILKGETPIYVGTAKNLNQRLNTEHGSLDNFANSDRKSDPKRNFIKFFSSIGHIENISVCIIKEDDLGYGELSKLDRHNIEKYIDILREEFTFIKNNKGVIK